MKKLLTKTPKQVEKEKGNVCKYGNCAFMALRKFDGYCRNHKK